MTNADMCCNNGVVQKYKSTKNVQQIPDTINTTFSVCVVGEVRGEGWARVHFQFLLPVGRSFAVFWLT